MITLNSIDSYTVVIYIHILKTARKLHTVKTFGHSSIMKMIYLRLRQFFIYEKMKQEALQSLPDQSVHSFSHQLYWSWGGYPLVILMAPVSINLILLSQYGDGGLQKPGCFILNLGFLCLTLSFLSVSVLLFCHPLSTSVIPLISPFTACLSLNTRFQLTLQQNVL